jgi:membrane-bound lytic murein transglycosylase D
MTFGSRRGSPVAALALVVVLGGCQRVGVGSAPAPAPVPIPPQLVEIEPLEGLPKSAPIAPIRPVRVSSDVDPILHTPVPLDAAMEARIDYWIRRWTAGGGRSFQRDLERLARFSPVVEEALELRGMPRSLRALPIIESGYNPAIRSRSGAGGLWQIMPGTAAVLGLRVNSGMDERLDPVRSTEAALDYLSLLHGQFDSWFLALAAYNAGQGRIRSLVQGAPAHESGDAVYVRMRGRFPSETRDFVPRFLAAARLVQNPELYGLEWPEDIEPWTFDEIVVPDATALDVVARAAGVELSEIRELNPHLLRGQTPAGQATRLRIPKGLQDQFETAYAEIPVLERVPFVEHRVMAGETLSAIASRYGISVGDVQRANPGLDPRRLRIGHLLMIPVATAVAQGVGAGARGVAVER